VPYQCIHDSDFRIDKRLELIIPKHYRSPHFKSEIVLRALLWVRERQNALFLVLICELFRVLILFTICSRQVIGSSPIIGSNSPGTYNLIF